MDTGAASRFPNCNVNFPFEPWCQNVEELLRLTQFREQYEYTGSGGNLQIIERAEHLKQDILASMRDNPNFTQVLEETIGEGPSDQSRGKSAVAWSKPESGASASHQNPSEASGGPAGSMITSEASDTIPELEAVGSTAMERIATVVVPAFEVGVGKDPAVGGEPGEAQCPPDEVQRPWAPGDTTLLVRNIPWDVSQDELIAQWPIDGSYNFFFLPHADFLGRRLGTAIINFVSPEHAARFRAKWEGQRLSRHNYKKALSISMAETQGRDENLKRVKEDASMLPVVMVGGKLFEQHGVLQLVRLAKVEAFGH